MHIHGRIGNQLLKRHLFSNHQGFVLDSLLFSGQHLMNASNSLLLSLNGSRLRVQEKCSAVCQIIVTIRITQMTILSEHRGSLWPCKVISQVSHELSVSRAFRNHYSMMLSLSLPVSEQRMDWVGACTLLGGGCTLTEVLATVPVL